MYEKQITLLRQKISSVQINVQESTNNLSIAIETAPKQDDVNYDHLD